MAGEGEALGDGAVVAVGMVAATEELCDRVNMAPVLDLVCQPNIADDDLLLQRAEQPHRFLSQRVDAERCFDSNLALVIAVDADDVPAGQDERARVGLLVAVEEVAEEGDCFNALLAAVRQRPFERPCRSVNVGEDADASAQRHWAGTIKQSTTFAPFPCSNTSSGLMSISDTSSRRSRQRREKRLRMSVTASMSAGCLAACAFEDRLAAQPVDHPARVAAGQWRDAELHVLQDLDEDAAEADRDRRAEGRVLGHAEDQLAPALDHLLNEDAADLCAAVVGAGVVDDLLESGADRLGVGDAEQDAAGLGLVGDVRRLDLEDDRVADLVSGGDGVVGVRDQPLLGDRDIVERQQLLRLALDQWAATGGADDLTRLFGDGGVGGRSPVRLQPRGRAGTGRSG